MIDPLVAAVDDQIGVVDLEIADGCILETGEQADVVGAPIDRGADDPVSVAVERSLERALGVTDRLERPASLASTSSPRT